MRKYLCAIAIIGVVVCLPATMPAGSTRADNGDSGTPVPSGATDAAVTEHVGTYDDIAPRLDESDPTGKYVPGNSVPFFCTFSGIPGGGFPQWMLVNGTDNAVTLEGQVTSSKLAWDDNPIDHHSRDRNFFVYPDHDPAHPEHDFAHLLAAPGNFHEGEENELGRIEVEWETAAFPSWALPMMGDWVHVEGSHIWDCAHGENGYRTEIHPPRLVMTIRDAADQWSKGATVLPARPGWADAMPGLGSIPVPVTRADVFASSDGGEAREQETCFNDPVACEHHDWYQPLDAKDYDLVVPAPPKPTDDAQLITKIIHHPFRTCNSDDGCGGAVDVFGAGPAPDPNRIALTEESGGPTGHQVHIHVNFAGFTEPDPSFLYGFGFTLEVGWNKRVPVDLHRVKVTIESVHVADTLDPSGPFHKGEWEVSSLIGDTFRHLRLTGNGVTDGDYGSHQDVPDTESVDVGDYGIKDTGSCALDAPDQAISDPAPCRTSFEVTLLPGQPLRVFFRGEEHDPENANDEAGTVERIATESDNYAIGEHTEWLQERTSAGADALDVDCSLPNPAPCASITYKVEDDPFPAPPGTTLSPGTPKAVQGGTTWVTSATGIGLTATAANGHAGDEIDLHERFWRSGTAAPSDSVCGTGTGAASCAVHLDANDGADGPYTLEYFAEDTVTGAIEPTQTALFMLDNTAPTTSASLAGTLVRGWYDTPVTVTLAPSDGAGVGVDHTSYSVDGGTSSTYSAPFVVSGDSSSHAVLFSSVDKLANTEAGKNVSFKIDGTPPTLGISNASDGTFSYTQNELLGGMFTNASSLTVSYAASDALSGVYAVRLDGASIASPAGTGTVALPAGISTHSLVAEDVAGNLTTLTFSVVSVAPGPLAPQGAGFWKNAVANGDYATGQLASFLAGVDTASRAFGAPDNRYADATLATYQAYLAPGPSPTPDQKVRLQLLTAWLNLVSGRLPAAQTIDLKSVSGWQTVVKDTGGSSVTTALNLVREGERRLGENPSSTLLDTIQSLLDKLNNLKK
jgi:hypothetical protein